MSLLERIYYFHNRIENNRYPNSGDLIREFEVSPATAHRDIAYLRDRLLAPLAFSQKNNGYYYTTETFRLPFEDTPRLILLLGMLEKMAAETGLTDMPELKKLQGRLRELVTHDCRDIDELVYCEWIETEPVNSRVFTEVLNGLINRERLDIRYRTPAGTPSERHIDPLRLVNYQGRWYILAWCCLRRSKRMFHLARIAACKPTGTKTVHTLASDDDWLSGSFGIFKGDAATRYTAEILFTGTAADIIGHQVWHPKQNLTETEDGVILSLPVADDRELVMKILQFGHEVRILHPEELRRNMISEIKKMAGQYKNTGK